MMTRNLNLYFGVALAAGCLLAACGGDDKKSTTAGTNPPAPSANLEACQTACWKGCNEVSSCNAGLSCEEACKDGDAVCGKVCYDGMSAEDLGRLNQAYACAFGCHPATSCEACLKDCFADPDCRLLAACSSACADGDSDCEAACMQTYPKGVSPAAHAEQCAKERNCK